MAFAIAATRRRRPTTITGASAVDVSYPGFFDDARSAHATVTVDKILPRRVHGRGQDDGRARAGGRLGWHAEDVDELIEARERRTVADIFARTASPTSAALEREILQLLLPLRHVVVATGGGTFVDPDNRAAINRDGLSVWLDVPFEDAARRGFPPTAAGRLRPTGRRWSGCLPPRRLAYAQAHLRRRRAAALDAEAIVERILRRHHRAGAARAGSDPTHGGLPRPLRHPLEPRRARGRASRRVERPLGSRCSCSAISSATAASPTASSIACRALEPGRGHPRQPRQGGVRPRRRQQLQPDRASTPRCGPARR